MEIDRQKLEPIIGLPKMGIIEFDFDTNKFNYSATIEVKGFGFYRATLTNDNKRKGWSFRLFGKYPHIRFYKNSEVLIIGFHPM